MTVPPDGFNYSWQERLLDEWNQLHDRIDKLREFILRNDAFNSLPDEDREDMEEQLVHMQRYYAVLTSRTTRHCWGL